MVSENLALEIDFIFIHFRSCNTILQSFSPIMIILQKCDDFSTKIILLEIESCKEKKHGIFKLSQPKNTLTPLKTYFTLKIGTYNVKTTKSDFRNCLQ